MAYTTIDNPALYFNTLTWTGDDADSRDITGVGFQPDWVWGRRRDDAAGHNLLDVVRGAGQDSELATNTTGIEGSNAQDRFGFLSAFLSDGFRVEDGSEASGDKAYWNQNSATYVAWNWKAGGSASSNTNGTITSSVSANQTAGFSIATYTGNGTSGATFGHGLSSAPEMVWLKSRGTTGNWRVGATPVDSTFNKVINVNLGNAPASASSIFNSTAPSSTLVTLGNEGDANGNTNTFVAYCFHSVKGYSAVSSYAGNGNSNGRYVHLGFEPAFAIIKDITSTDPWHMIDNKRSPRNLMNARLFPQNSNAENTSADICDFVSNGIKFRGTNDGFNGNRNYLIYAVAKAPFVNSNGVPNNAR